MNGIQSAAGEPSMASQAESGSLMLRARSEFLEMPGLRLTTPQAARLWALDRLTCERILERLVVAGFLWRRRDGSYLRVSRT